jgi:pimeloyl-ACP methyl ester carboxylesterase
MLPLLPPFLESTDVTPGVPGRVVVTRPNDELAVAYSVLLPPEYSAARSYPLILALHHAQRDAPSEIEFWGGTAEQPGQAQRHGYIVIAPEYLPQGARTHDYTAETQRVILESLFDARRRFNVDSDRIFLAGHGTGGDAVFDLGMSHPDLFAGAIPMGGVADRICNYIFPNAESLPWFVIVGELDRGAIAGNPRNISRMLQQGYDIIYAQHLGAGADSFYSEIHRLFNWMSRIRRKKYEKGEMIEFLSLRNCDTTTHWLSFGALPESILRMDWNNPKGGRVLAMKVEAKVNPGNVLLVTSQGAGHTAWLSPDFVDFDKRLSVRLNAKVKSNDFPKPDIGVMLEDFHRRADRQRLYWAAVSF